VVSVDGEALAVDEAAPTSAWSAVESLRRAAEHVSRELASLPDERRAVLRLMAVMGRRFERTALLRAADDPGSRLPRGIVLDTFDDALRCGLIEAEAAASDQYRFTHEVVRTLVMNGRHP